MKRLLAILIAINLSASGLYGRSIQSLRTTGATPSVGRYQKRLNLSGRGISSLEGLGEVRNIERASIVRLDNNDISTLPEGVLAPVEDTVQVLNLSNNKITAEGLRGLIGLKNLRALILNSNNINDITPEVLDSLPKLTFISLYDNPISIEKVNQLRHKGYYISTLPITRANLKKAGLTAAALAGLILSAVGTAKLVKSKIKTREQKREFRESDESSEFDEFRDLEELGLKKYERRWTGKYRKTNKPLVTRVEEIDTDTEYEEE
jgi:hypothetical protein